MDVGIVAQRNNERAASLAETLRARLLEDGVTVLLDAATAGTLGYEGAAVDTYGDCDLVVSIGGDGTFLYAARGANGTPILGVNLGEVGFLNAVRPTDAERVVSEEVEAFRNGTFTAAEVPRIAAHGDDWTSEPAVNEIVVQGGRRGRGGGGTIEVRIDGARYTTGRADGVLVATPTGSTAYNLSERGPLVHPSVDALVVNEMAASEGMPPLVVPADSDVTVTVTEADHAVIVSDGRTRTEVSTPASVHVKVADEPVRIAGPPVDFFEALGKLD